MDLDVKQMKTAGEDRGESQTESARAREYIHIYYIIYNICIMCILYLCVYK